MPTAQYLSFGPQWARAFGERARLATALATGEITELGAIDQLRAFVDRLEITDDAAKTALLDELQIWGTP